MNRFSKSVIIKFGDEQIEVRYSQGVPRAVIKSALRDVLYEVEEFATWDLNVYETNIPEGEPVEPPVVELASLAGIGLEEDTRWGSDNG